MDLRDDYLRWIADLPAAATASGPDLRRRFAVDAHASLWWFSLVAEKSPFKSDSFNSLAQLTAISGCLRLAGSRRLVCAIAHPRLRRSLDELARENGIEFAALGFRWARALREAVEEWPTVHLARGALRASWYALRIFLRGQFLRFALPGVRMPTGRTLLVTAGWPSFDLTAVRSGLFRHRDAGILVQSLEGAGERVAWCLIWNPAAVDSFVQAVRQARRFMAKGTWMVFPECFLGIGSILRVASAWVRCARRFCEAEPAIASAHKIRGVSFYELFKDDWYSSFAGVTGCIGLLYYDAFKTVFRNYPFEKCLYYCEMREWEKALLCAALAEKPARTTLGYQCGTVSPMLLNYFHAPSELTQSGAYAMPRPERFLCNGELNRRRFSESGWTEQNLAVVEAIKYSHVRMSLLRPVPPKERLVLVAFSIGLGEAAAELAMVYEALHDIRDVEVRIRPHPGMPLAHVLRRAGFPESVPPFPVASGPLDDWLQRARIVIGGETGVTVEGLAFGCRVVTIKAPEHFNMSPLRGLGLPDVGWVSSARELRHAVEDCLALTRSKTHDPATVSALREFFFFNEGSDEPERFINLLRSSSDEPAIVAGGMS